MCKLIIFCFGPARYQVQCSPLKKPLPGWNAVVQWSVMFFWMGLLLLQKSPCVVLGKRVHDSVCFCVFSNGLELLKYVSWGPLICCTVDRRLHAPRSYLIRPNCVAYTDVESDFSCSHSNLSHPAHYSFFVRLKWELLFERCFISLLAQKQKSQVMVYGS